MWQVAASNGSVRVTRQRLHPAGGPSGSPCQELAIQAVNATYVHAICPIPPSYAIGEFRPSVWVRADRPRLQLFARVLLPQARHPESGRPLMALIPGTIYQRTGDWEQLQVSDLRRGLADQVQLLRSQFGPHVQAAGAYVDALVMNVYGGPGHTQVWLENPELDGAVPRAISDQIGSASSVSVRIVAGRLEIDGRPFFARAAPLGDRTLDDWARAGVNTVVLSEPVTAERAARAEALGLWLVAPPPADPHEARAALHQRVIAWKLAPGQAPPDRRPILPATPLPPRDHPFVQLVDANRQHPDPPGGADVVGGLAASVRWGRVDIAPDPLAVAQARALGRSPGPPFLPTQNQLHQRLLAALAQGVRGVWLDTAGLAVEETSEAELRIEELNAHLELWAPWLAAGHWEPPLPTSTPQLQWSVWALPESRLLLPLYRSHRPVLQLPVDSVEFTLPSPHELEEVVRVGLGDVSPVSQHRTAGGQRISVSDVSVQTMLVASPHRRTIQQVVRQIVGRQVETAELKRARIEAEWKELCALRGAGVVAAADTQSLDILLRRLAQRIEDRDARMASELAERADQMLLEQWGGFCLAIGPLAAVSNPVSHYPQTLPAARLLGLGLERRRPTGNLLPGGDCEDLDRMGRAGWQAGPADAAAIALEARTRRHGRSALRLEHHPGPGPPPPEGIWIHSPPVALEAGDIVEVTAWVRIEVEPSGPAGVGSVYCSLAGSRPIWRSAHANRWEPVSFAAAVDRPGNLDVSFRLDGDGALVVDQVEILRYPSEGTDQQLAEVR